MSVPTYAINTVDRNKGISLREVDVAEIKLRQLLKDRLGEHGEKINMHQWDGQAIFQAMLDGISLLHKELMNTASGNHWSLEEIEYYDFEEQEECTELGICRHCGGILLSFEGWRCYGQICLKCGNKDGDLMD